jgi:hypothetical protein
VGISWICFCTEKYFGKKLILPCWAEPEGLTRFPPFWPNPLAR